MYEYTLPTFVFKKKTVDSVQLDDQVTVTSEMEDFRIDASTLCLLRQGLALFEGTHNFHNFTIGKEFGEASATRFIRSFKVIKVSCSVMSL